MRDDMRRDPQTDEVITGSPVGQGRLMRLEDTKDLEVADGDPDVRGWKVKGDGDRDLGKVDDLIVDPDAMKVRYLLIKLDKDVAENNDERHVLIPVGIARLFEDTDDVRLNLTPAALASLPAFDKDRLDDREYQATIRERCGITTTADQDIYANPAFDDQQFFGARRTGREQDPYFVRNPNRP
jgi:photosynthetic reaction center H subunit